MGKTRLMIELCSRLSRPGSDNWHAGFLNHRASASGWSAPIDALFEGDRPLLIIVDYAETRSREVVELLKRAVDSSTRRVRMVLLARRIGDWWVGLTSASDGIGSILMGPATDITALDPLAPLPDQRRSVFEGAASAFKVVVGGTMPRRAPALDAEHYDRVLYVLVTALAAVQGESVDKEQDLLDWALSRERGFLGQGAESIGCGHLRGRAILQCTAVATLAGRVDSRAEALRILSHAPLLEGEPAAVVDHVAELLHRLYPGEAWLQGLLPDLLGEHLIKRAAGEDPDLLASVFGS
jgi:hypothetical protein